MPDIYARAALSIAFSFEPLSRLSWRPLPRSSFPPAQLLHRKFARRSLRTFETNARVFSPQVSHREFDLTVGKLPPVFDNSRISDLRKLIEDFAGFATSRVNRQREYLRLRARHSVC